MKIPSLVSSRWLAQALLNFKNKPMKPLRIVDATYREDGGAVKGREKYLNKHIPGAVFFDIDECSDKSSEYPQMLPSEKEFSEYAQYLGITNDCHVIAYEYNKEYALFSSARVWWMFRCFGHNNVSILNGGFTKWLEAGYPIDYGEEYLSDANEPFKANLNKDLVRQYEEMLENVQAGGAMFPVVDSLGEDMSLGRIPHSTIIPFVECFDRSEQILKDPVQLREMFEENGIDLSKPFTVTCGTGVTAGIIAFAAHLCGNKDISVYDGSWAEWDQRAPPEMVEKTSSE